LGIKRGMKGEGKDGRGWEGGGSGRGEGLDLDICPGAPDRVPSYATVHNYTKAILSATKLVGGVA